MNINFLSIYLFLIFYTGLYARENPFEPTSIYKMELDRRMLMDKDSSSAIEEDEKNIHIVENIEEENKTDPLSDIKQKEILKEEKHSIDILPFVNIRYSNNEIQISSKYKVIKQFVLEKENKIVLDYDAKILFLTKSRLLNSAYFQKIIVGSHPQKGYFRVVIIVKDLKSKYTINYDKLVSIHFNKNRI